jgi:hypothetical protein
VNDHALSSNPLPAWARWAAVAWLAIWVPTYWHVWGPSTFLFLCDLSVVLTSIGIWTGNALLLSSQAVSSLVVDTAWVMDILWMLLFGKHLIGGTEYFFDPHYPLAVRLMSLFHIALPIVLLVSLRRTGYDPRALRLQSGIAAVVMIASRIINPQKNINFAITDPFFRRSWGPAPLHLAIILAALIIAIYLPTHIVLMRVFRRPKSPGTSTELRSP